MKELTAEEIIESIFKNTQRIHGKSESVDWIKVASIKSVKKLKELNWYYASQFQPEMPVMPEERKELPKPFEELFRCLEDSCYEINFYGNDGNDNQEKVDGKQLLISWITDALFEVLQSHSPVSVESKVTDEDEEELLIKFMEWYNMNLEYSSTDGNAEKVVDSYFK